MMNAAKPPVLLIEDSDEDFTAFTRAIKYAAVDYPLHRCKNGDLALDYLYQRNGYTTTGYVPHPVLILLDLNMPGTDGRQVLRRIKSDPKLKSIPVIVVTTSSNPKDVEECYRSGANSYLVKSVNFERFRREIKILTDYWLTVALLPATVEQEPE